MATWKPRISGAKQHELSRNSFEDVAPFECGLSDSNHHDDFIPPHYLLKVAQFEPTLKMEVLDYKWVSDLLDKQPGALSHIFEDPKPGEQGAGRLVLTANTAELQKFILKYADNTNAFTEGFTLERKR